MSILDGNSKDEGGKVTPADANIDMVTLLPMVEWYPWRGDCKAGFVLGGGIGFHKFSGGNGTVEVADPFWHHSYVLELSYRPFWESGKWYLEGISFGGGANYFREFETTDFAPLMVDVSTDGGELVFGYGFSVEYVFP